MEPVEQVASGIFMFSFLNLQNGLAFNQYLIDDDYPTLIHTGPAERFETLKKLLQEVTDLKKLTYIVASHFEGDEAGAALQFASSAVNAKIVCSPVTARQFGGFGFNLPLKVVKEGDTLSLGKRELQFLDYPSEMHLWPGLLPFEKTEGVLFSSDLFIRRGPIEEAVVEWDINKELTRVTKDQIPGSRHRENLIAKFQSLPIRMIAPGHGPCLKANADALYSNP